MRTAGWIPRASSRSSARACVSSSRAPASSSVAAAGSDASFDSTSAQRDGEGHEPLLRSVVEVALERAPCAILGLHEACSRGVEVLGGALALGDVDARDQEQAALVDLGQRGARPGDGQPAAVAGDPRVVVLLRRLAGGDRLDERAHLVGLGRIDEVLPQDLPADLRRRVAERVLERDVPASLR